LYATIIAIYDKALTDTLRAMYGNPANVAQKRIFTPVAKRRLRNEFLRRVKEHERSEDLLEIANNNFDMNFRRESTLVINIDEEMLVEDLQENIMRVMGASTEVGGEYEKFKLISRTDHLRRNMIRAAYRYRSHATLLMIITRFFSILAVTLTLVQGHISVTNADDVLQDQRVLWLWRANVVLPLCLTATLSWYAWYRPTSKFVALLAAAKQVEGEMWKFRMCVGQYRYMDNVSSVSNVPFTEDGNHGGTSNASHSTSARLKKTNISIFSDAIRRIWTECNNSDLANSDFARELDLNDLLTTFRQKENQELFSLRIDDDMTSASSENGTEANMRSDATNMTIDEGEEQPTARVGEGERGRDVVTIDEYTGSDVNPESGISRLEESLSDNLALEVIRDSMNTRPLSTNMTFDIRPDNMNMSVDDYILKRLLKSLEENQKEGARDSKKLRWLTFFVILVSGSSSAIAAFNAAYWIPLTIAIISLVEFAMSYLQLESCIPQSNAVVKELTDLLFEWDGLSNVQQKLPQEKDRLVSLTEEILLLKHRLYLRTTLAKEKENDAANEDNDKSQTLRRWRMRGAAGRGGSD